MILLERAMKENIIQGKEQADFKLIKCYVNEKVLSIFVIK